MASQTRLKSKIEQKCACGICSKEVKEEDKALQCDQCQLWYHATCLRVSLQKFTTLAQMPNWYCGDCMNFMLLKRITEVENSCSSIANLIKDIEEVKKENTALNMEIKKLKKDMDNIKLSNDRRDQYSLKNNLIISNMPESKGEDLQNTVCVLAKTLGVKAEGILAVHRLKEHKAQKPNEPKDIIVKFLLYEVKEKLLESIKSEKFKGKLKVGNGGNKDSTDVFVYLKDHLTPLRGYLLRKAKMHLKEKQLAYVWVKRGNVYARKEERSPARLLLSDNDLANVLNEAPSK